MNKKFLTIFAIMLTFTLALFSLVACGGKEGDNSSDSEKESPAITSEVGLTYAHTKTNVTWASDEAKATMLDEMECTEEEFSNLYETTALDVKFLDGGKATITYSMGGRGEIFNVFYKNEKGSVTFYDTQEDLLNGKVKTDKGLFAAEFKLSDDYKTLFWIAEMKNVCNVTLDCTIKK